MKPRNGRQIFGFQKRRFLTRDFTDEVTRAAKEIVDAMRTQEFATHAAAAVPKGLEVPNEAAHPNFLVVDFAICAEDDRLVPRLIELQAFPSLFGFQLLLLGCIRKAYPIIPRSWTSSFGGIKDEAYLDLLRRTIIAGSASENVVLLEIEPEKQKRGSISPPRKPFLVFVRFALQKSRNADASCFMTETDEKCASSAFIIG